MSSITQIFILIMLVLLSGIALGRIASKLFYRHEEKQTEQKAKLIIKEARITAAKIKRDKILEGKERFTRLKTEFQQGVVKKREKLLMKEDYLKAREQEILQQQEQLHRKELAVEKISNELEQLKFQKMQQLESIADLNVAEAQKLLVEALEDETRSKAAIRTRVMLDEAHTNAEKEAQKIILTTIQRTAAEQTIENCASVINIEKDVLKGKIIGREGRNIRALEAVTGVDIIIDESPKTILLSSFDSIRREIARLAILELIQDGRINPARIEETVAKIEKNIEKEIINAGERTAVELGIYGMHMELTKLVGKMRYRLSYRQNLLKHAHEVAHLAANMAAELGLNSELAKRAGLLHDIGKVSTEVSGRSHALLGMELAQKYREHPDVCNAIGAHHDEIEMTSSLAPIVQSCDAISGSRPGARLEILQAYTNRLKDMEDIALSFVGVKKCYAIQAGRELRVIVDSKSITDEQSNTLAFEIANKIEQQLQYPGQIKVIVIRETRTINYAQ